MFRYQNISLCQINVKTGQQEYYLPKNANWRGKKIEKIVAYIPLLANMNVKSPVDGQSVLVMNDTSDLYFDLYNEDGVNILHNVHAYTLIADNNFVLDIKQKLSFDLSRIYFTTAPQQDGALMLYIYYNETDLQVDEPTENVTVRFPLAAGETMTFQQVIEKYMFVRSKKVRYISIWNGNVQPVGFNTGYVTLRDTNGYLAHEYIPNFFLRPCIDPAYPSQFLLSENRLVLNVDLDMNNSFIVNTQSVQDDYIVTFYY